MKGRLAKDLQRTAGDVLFNDDQNRIFGVEVKTEEENRYNNFFLETWSNKSFGKPGWLRTLQTDFLFYVFYAERLLYIMNFPKLQNWASPWRLRRFPEKQQRKYDQMNDTWGHAVPIPVVQKEVGFNLRSCVDGIWY